MKNRDVSDAVDRVECRTHASREAAMAALEKALAVTRGWRESVTLDYHVDGKIVTEEVDCSQPLPANIFLCVDGGWVAFPKTKKELLPGVARAAAAGEIKIPTAEEIAYECAESRLASWLPDAAGSMEDGEDWYNLGATDCTEKRGLSDLTRAVAWLAGRGLLEHSPDRPGFVRIRPLSEAKPQTAAVAC